MQIRRAASLVSGFEDGQIFMQNFLTRQAFSCNGIGLDILAQLDEWTDAKEFMEKAPFEPKSLADTIGKLIENEAIVVEDTEMAELDEHYRKHWRWGAVAGMYQFSLRDQKFLEGEQIVERMEKYQEVGDAPPVLTSNEGLETTELPDFPSDDPFFNVLESRRSRREYSGKPISLADIATCLYAANGVKSINDHGPFGTLPRCMTPSGGARNPYELYVYVREVEDLKPGFYHYSAAEHSLGLVNDRNLPDPVELLGTQSWTNKAAAIVFMVATFERTAWKYRQPLAYRVVLMETGYIGQNLLLTANRLGIAAAPTGALAESRIEELLGTRPIEQAAIFAIVLGDPVEPFRE